MAARLWWLISGAEVLLVALAAAAVAALLQWPSWTWLLLVPPGVMLLKGALVGVSFLLARIARGPAAQPAAGRHGASLWLRESLSLMRAEWRIGIEPWRPSADIDEPGPGQPVRPVLLIHGFVCSRAVWRPLLARLRAAGIGPVRAVSFEPLFGDIAAHGARLERELRGLQGRSGGKRVCIVAHSTGGLIARSILRSIGSGLIEQLVTIATPHHGTRLARLAAPFPWVGPRQLACGSEFLRGLNADPASTATAITCLYSLQDNIVFPAETATLPEARCHALQGLGHMQLLESGRVHDQVLEILRGDHDERQLEAR